MSCLFLIGNGFDLNCGLKTRYTDIYKGYVKTESKSEYLKRFKGNIESDLDNWGDFEMALAGYAKTCKSEDEILECITDFTKYMKGHIIGEQERFHDILKDFAISSSIVEEMRKSLMSYYKNVTHNVDDWMEKRNASNTADMRFCTFNYTDSFDAALSEYWIRERGVKKTVLHIHGRISEDPTLGVDNEEQLELSYNLSRKGRRRLIKPIFNNEYDSTRVNFLRSWIDEAQIICAFGLSLGDSDYTWRNAIIQSLSTDSSKRLLYHDFELSKKRGLTAPERMDEEDDAKAALLKRWGLNEDSGIYNQIHMPCGENIFNIEKAINKVQKIAVPKAISVR